MNEPSAASLPRFEPPAHGVITAEAATGIILHEDGRRWIQDDASPWKVFPTFESALRWAEQTVARFPLFECNICDHDGNPVRRVWQPEAFTRAPSEHRR